MEHCLKIRNYHFLNIIICQALPDASLFNAVFATSNEEIVLSVGIPELRINNLPVTMLVIFT